MTQLAHPFFGGSHLLPELLSRVIDNAADMAEVIARINPEHELLDYFVGFDLDPEVILEKFQVRFGRPGATCAERYTEAGQTYFWQRYAEALKVALHEAPFAACDRTKEVVAGHWSNLS